MKLKCLGVKLAVVFIACMTILNGCLMSQQDEKGDEEISAMNSKPGSNRISLPIEVSYKVVLESQRRQFGSSYIIDIACGKRHSLALAADGTVWAVGSNSSGQLGFGDKGTRCGWAKTSLRNIKAIACGYFHSLALSNDGKIYVAGENNWHQLGGNHEMYYSWEEMNINNIKFKAIACGYHHSLAISTNGSVYATGSQSERVYDEWTYAGIENIKAIACGEYFSLVLGENGNVRATGENYHGQLGLSDNEDRSTWDRNYDIPFDDFRKVAIACGRYHSLAIISGGAVFVTGYNNFGQLGRGDMANHNEWRAAGLVNIKTIACGSFHSLALSDNGKVWATGRHICGELGLGDINGECKFVWTETDLGNIKAIACGDTFSLALSDDGRIRGTGANYHGEIGNISENIGDIEEFTYSPCIYSGPAVIFNEYSRRFMGPDSSARGAGLHTSTSLATYVTGSTSRTQLKKIAYEIIDILHNYVMFRNYNTGRYLCCSDDNKKVVLGGKGDHTEDKEYHFRIEWLGDGSWARIKHRGSNKYLFSGKNTADPLLLFKSIDDENPELGFNFFVDRIFDL